MELDRPEAWRLKGEGNANWVFAYEGDHPGLVGTVLRVRKPKTPQAPQDAALEEAVWAPVLGSPLPDASPTVAAAAREHAYVQRCMAPLLGRRHVPCQRPVQPSAAFLRDLLAGAGLHAAVGDLAADGGPDLAAAVVPGLAALMPDVTLLEPGGQAAAEGPAVCVELKPKCGFVGACATVHPAHRALKRSASRFQLHQALKLAQGKVGAPSAYDPPDLFSSEPARVRAALAALLAQPQNNLALFLGGRRQRLAGRQRSGSGGEPPEQQPQGQPPQEQQQQQQGMGVCDAVDAALAGLLSLPAGERRGALVELLAAVLEREGVLPRLLAAQRQCPYDVEGVYRLYCQLTGVPHAEEPPHAAGDGGGGAHTQASDDHAAAVARLLALPRDEALGVLRSYVVAATAKDCGLMIALRRLAAPPPDAADAPAAARGPWAVGASRQEAPSVPSGNDGGGWAPPVGRLYCAAAGAWYAYRLAVVDLDLKPLSKLPAHHALDAAIVAAARSRQQALEQRGGGGGAVT